MTRNGWFPRGSVGGSVTYVKPHGALYNRMGVDEELACAVIEALVRCGCPMLLAQSGTTVVDLAQWTGITVAAEAFADRGYRHDGTLVPRGEPDAVITDPGTVARRAVSIAARGGIETVTGSWLALNSQSLCVHGDTPEAARAARMVRASLEGAGVTLRSFAGSEPLGTTGSAPDP